MVDYEYEHEDDYGPRVLWGRVAFFVVGLVLAFLLGTCVGGDGGSSAELTQRNREVAELSTEVAVLEQRLAASQDGNGDGGQAEGEGDDGAAAEGDGGDGGGDGEGDGGDDEEAAEGQDPVEEEGQTYVVESGDTLTRIATRFYGDPQLWTLIRDANNLTGDLQVGQEIVIPPQE